MTQMKVTFFGYLGDALGAERLIEVPDAGLTVAELRQALRAADGVAAPLLGNTGVRAVVDEEIAREDSWVLPGQEVDFLPPLSGG